MNPHPWREFLKQWSRDILKFSEYAQDLPPEVVSSGWVGYPGATAAQIAQAEARLKTTLPPSYREFLQVTNGWRTTTPSIDKLWSVEEIDWFASRHQDWIDAWLPGSRLQGEPSPVSDKEYFIYGEEQDPCVMREDYLQAALEISDVGDSAIYLLNPKVVTAEGEWEAWFFAS